MAPSQATSMAVLGVAHLDDLLDSIRAYGFTVIGPQIKDGELHFGEIASAQDFPRGWIDEQQPGRYQLTQTEEDGLFDYSAGADSWKPYLFPPSLRLFRSTHANGSVTLEEPRDLTARLAFFGVRPCDLAAIAIQDRVFLRGTYVDPSYAERRKNSCLIAVNCRRPAATCFCSSMNTGPRASGSFDLALTEIGHSAAHRFLVEIGSEVGERIMEKLGAGRATDRDFAEAESVTREATERIERRVDAGAARHTLTRSRNSPRWQELAERCLNCGNCTMVCPTCFCWSVEDTTDLSGMVAERTRRWESCFTSTHSYIHGGPVHLGGASRYRQWMTHKFSSWWDQFGTSGCVGCGRCVTWCPVGIDITAELAAIQREETSHVGEDATASS